MFCYGLLTRLTNRFDVQNICLLAAITATNSKALSGVSQRIPIILFARVLWGMKYAVPFSITVSSAVQYRQQIVTRIGIGQPVRKLGPIMALLLGEWSVAVLGL